MTYPAAFTLAFATTVGLEGGLSLDPNDSGNYANGKLVGTKYGISARSYPTLNIPSLTLSTAQAIYWTDYWLKARCDVLPPRLAVFMFDSAVNNGVVGSIGILQTAIGTTSDGVFGHDTLTILGAVLACGVDALCAEFLARRTFKMACLDAWQTQGLGWSRRLCKLPFLTQGITA